MKKLASKSTKKVVEAKPVEVAETPTIAPDLKPELQAEPAAASKTRKKADTEIKSPAIQIVEAEQEAVAPVKKAVKKGGKTASGKASKKAAVGPKPEFKQAIAAQLDAPKKLRKAKGRDLVVDVPGAEEVADVLGTAAPEVQEGADEIAGESKPADDAVVAGSAPEGKLERLQKILAKAGISSRRKAEELILEGRVQINGQIVKELGTKADMARDHVRVDGKLLQGAERIRYFVLNKPKGFVTTVSDPEGRPTVMEFFSNERERLYPVGRLDYLSEGLLLVTNDGELANKLTKAASGVEKTYLVKVAGQPTDDMLDVLRTGVVIERGRPGTNSGRVRTAPAKIRQVRQGDNPWYEVIVIEGRNRELRKMFEEIGHHVEKIRRIGYGPLVLDQEPGKMRELEPEEVQALRLTADGKLKPKRRKGPAEAQLPTVAGKTVRYKKADGKPGFEPRRVRPEFQQESKSDAPPSVRIAARDSVRPAFKPAAKSDFKTDFKAAGRSDSKPFTPRSGGRADARPAFRSEKPGFGGDRKTAPRAEPNAGPKLNFSEGRPSGRPEFGRGASAGRPSFGAKARRPEPPVTDYVLPPRKPQPEGFDEAPSTEFNPDYKPGFRTGGKAGFSKPAFRKDTPPKRFGGRSGSDRGESRFDETGASTAPPFNSSERGDKERGDKFDKPKFARSGGEREAYPDAPAEKRVKLGIEPVVERAREPRTERLRAGGFGGGAKPFRPAGDRADSGRSGSERPGSERFGSERAGGDRPAFKARPSAGDRPYKSQRDRPQGDRPQGERSGTPTGRPYRPKMDGPPREFRPRQAGPRASGERSGPARPFNPRPGGTRPGAGRAEGAPPRRERPFEGGNDRPRESRPAGPRSDEFKPRSAGPRDFKPGAAKKFGPKPGFAAKSRAGSDGPPRGDAPVKKERWRNSFTGKNKGRPKPKGPKGE